MLETKTTAEDDLVASDPDERFFGDFMLHRLEAAASTGDVLAEALLRAHAMHAGFNAFKALSQLAAHELKNPAIRLHSPMKRHSDYLVVLPNVFIDLKRSWLVRLKKMSSSEQACKMEFARWKFIVPRSNCPFSWFLRCMEAILPETDGFIPLLAGIINFRVDAAMPCALATSGNLRVGHSAAPRIVLKEDQTSSLRNYRKHSQQPGILSVNDTQGDPFSRWARFLQMEFLDSESEQTRRHAPTAERKFSAVKKILFSIRDGLPVPGGESYRAPWKFICTHWQKHRKLFPLQEAESLDALFAASFVEASEGFENSTLSSWQLVPPATTAEIYLRAPRMLINDFAWAAMTLMLRCGLRAADLFEASAKSFSGLGSQFLTFTQPWSKTTGRRSLAVGYALSPVEIDRLTSLITSQNNKGKSNVKWFSEITGEPVPGRENYDGAYLVLRRSFSEGLSNLLPLHTPRHAFATSLMIYHISQILRSFRREYFRIWTDDSHIHHFDNTGIPSLLGEFSDLILVANQTMGHSSPHEFIRTYCHAWPLLIGAMAESRRPGKLPWHQLEQITKAQ